MHCILPLLSILQYNSWLLSSIVACSSLYFFLTKITKLLNGKLNYEKYIKNETIIIKTKHS